MPVEKRWRVGVYQETIVRVHQEELQPGRLAQLFQSGAKAVILTGDERVAQLWEGLLGPKPDDSTRVRDDTFPWENSFLNTARNHRSGDILLGDMWRFIPGALAHIARKRILWREPGQQKLQVIPESFWNGTMWVPLPQALLHTAWELMADIFSSALLDGSEPPPYAVKIEQLKYPHASEALEKMFDLLADSGGTWAHIGQRVDAYKAVAAGPFDAKIVRDLFGCASLIPGVRPLLHRVNALLRTFSAKNVPRHTRLIGDPHVDGGKMLTALASDRDVLLTEIYDGRCWLELPLSREALAIFPAKNISTLGVTPTRHRILMQEPEQSAPLARANVTLSLAIVDRLPEGVRG